MKYFITTPVESVKGWQLWKVEAESEQDALDQFKSGRAIFVEEDINVMSLGKPVVEKDFEDLP